MMATVQGIQAATSNAVYVVSAVFAIAAVLGGASFVFRRTASKAQIEDLTSQLATMRNEVADWRQRHTDMATALAEVKAQHETLVAKMLAELETLRAENTVLTEKVTNAAKVDKMVALLTKMDNTLTQVAKAALK